jgi:hypothetical protein
MDNSGENYSLSDEDFIKGVTTIEDKKQKNCPFFNWWNTLYGGRQNVNPTSVLRSSSYIDNDLLNSIISTNDQNEDDDCFVRENETEHLVSQSPKNINDAVQIHPSVPVINDVYDITPVKSNKSIKKSASSSKQPFKLEISTQIKALL